MAHAAGRVTGSIDMGADNPGYLEVGEGAARRRIAYLSAPPKTPGGPGILWLIGLKSDMASTKAAALADWTAARGIGMTRFDYSGHGQSGGDFEDATIGDWLEEAEAVFTRVARGPQIVVGSSTGGHIALLLLRRLMKEQPAEATRLKGLVLIAPAWDLTEELMWKVFPEEARREIMEKGVWCRPSPYDPAGYAITRRFIEEGRKHLLARQPFDPGRPIAILQGAQDVDVPLAHARELASFLEGGWVTLTEVPDGEHRLSRPEDLALLYGLIDRQLAAIKP
jgi:alpha-beta hydrolase superfamily lysophospholipase